MREHAVLRQAFDVRALRHTRRYPNPKPARDRAANYSDRGLTFWPMTLNWATKFSDEDSAEESLADASGYERSRAANRSNVTRARG